MKKTIILVTLFLNSLVFAYGSKIKGIYAIGVFDQNKNGENVQHVLKTKNDYNGSCYTKIFILGVPSNITPQVKIGKSRGHYQSRISIFNRKKIKIGEELLYKHYKVTKGYIEVKLNGKLYDTKVFVK
ncbi:MAG: hypothetical protein ACNI25_12310 [Halarcobacter sp.]